MKELNNASRTINGNSVVLKKSPVIFPGLISLSSQRRNHIILFVIGTDLNHQKHHPGEIIRHVHKICISVLFKPRAKTNQNWIELTANTPKS